MSDRTPLPPDHPQRIELNDEVHARPPDALIPPVRASYIALLGDSAQRDAMGAAVADLARRYGVPPPPPGTVHWSADLGHVRLKWERHSEFSRCLFTAPAPRDGDPFDTPAIAAVPGDWLANLPGQLIMAAHAVILPATADAPDLDRLARSMFWGHTLVGATVLGGAGLAFTDFRVHADGFGRFYVEDHGLSPEQAGRILQRLLEIDTYRILALLALPIAREQTPFLARSEADLAAITQALTQAGEADEPSLLGRLTRLAAEIESRQGATRYRFSAAAAYYELVRARIAELREDRIRGTQTFSEFTERRLAPAMNTCQAVAQRQEALSERVARATQLLSTSVEIGRQQQAHAVLERMDRRARLQLRLQETVEGLSVAAITYYVIGLVGYAAKGVRAAGVAIDPDVATGVTIPFVATAVWLAVRHLRRVATRGVV